MSQLTQVSDKELCTVVLDNKQKIAYREFGEKNGQPLILIHSRITSQYYWDQLTSYLLKPHLYRIITLDLRGHGGSSYINSITRIEDYAQDVYLFCKKLQIDSAFFAGWALGGLIVSELAIQHPELVKKIILVNSESFSGSHVYQLNDEGQPTETKLHSPEEIRDHQTISNFSNMMDKQMENDFKDFFKIKLFSPDNWPQMEDSRYKFLSQQSFMSQTYQDDTVATHFYDISQSGSNLAQDIQCPVLIYQGEQDQMIPIDSGLKNIKEIGEGQCKIVVNKDCGHSPLLETPEHLSKQITEFLAH